MRLPFQFSILLTAGALLLDGTTSATSDDADDAHCSMGEAMAIAQNQSGAALLLDRFLQLCAGGQRDGLACNVDADCPEAHCGPPQSIAGLEDGRDFCQYRAFIDSQRVCFCEQDVFHPGVSLRFATLDEGRAFLEDYEAHLYWAPEGGESLEMPLLMTPLKAEPGSEQFGLGPGVFTEMGVLLAPGPGRYTSTFTDFHPSVGEFIAVTQVEVLPHDIAHELGPAPSAFDGSVVCPP